MLDGKLPSEKWKKFPLIREKLRSGNKQECETLPYTTCEEESEESEEEELEARKQRKRKRIDFSEYVVDEPSVSEKRCAPIPAANTMSDVESSDNECEEDDRMPSPPKKIRSVASTSIANTPPRHSSPTGWTLRILATPPRQSTSSPLPVSPRRSPRGHNSFNQDRPTSGFAIQGNSTARQDRVAVNICTPHSSNQQSLSRSTNREPRTRADVKAMPFPMPEEKFQKKIFYMLVDMRMDIKELKEGRNEQVGSSVSGQLLHLPDPAETMEEVLQIDRSLATTIKQEEMIQILCRIGGNSAKDNARKTMEKLMSNDIMSTLNMQGKKGKSAFCKLNLFKVVKESVMRTIKCTETEAVNAIAVTLKYAPDRRGGSGRKRTVYDIMNE